MGDLHYALYHSQSVFPASSDLHNDILRVSKANNDRDHLTGFLHREGDHFIQYIEGPKTHLYNTLARIGRDPRHKGFSILKHAAVHNRLLPDWSMGFVDHRALNLSDLLDVSEGRLDVKALDPFDLVVFLVNNASALRPTAQMA